jgi:hypothetical protein
MSAPRHGSHVHSHGSGKTYPWTIAGIIIGAVGGLLSGMAYANTFTRDLLPLLAYSLLGAVVFGAILGAVGWVIDLARGR